MSIARRPLRSEHVPTLAHYGCADCRHNWTFHEGVQEPVDGARAIRCRGWCKCRQFWCGDRAEAALNTDSEGER